MQILIDVGFVEQDQTLLKWLAMSTNAQVKRLTMGLEKRSESYLMQMLYYKVPVYVNLFISEWFFFFDYLNEGM